MSAADIVRDPDTGEVTLTVEEPLPPEDGRGWVGRAALAVSRSYLDLTETLQHFGQDIEDGTLQWTLPPAGTQAQSMLRATWTLHPKTED